MLESRSHRVLTAVRGTEALLLAKQEMATLILLDVRLPDMNGYQVCRKLNSSPETEQIPVVMYSSQNLVGNNEAELSGATTFLNIQVDSTVLFAVIHGTLAKTGSRRDTNAVE